MDSTAPTLPAIAWDNSYARLPAPAFVATRPTPVAAPKLLLFNRALARELGLDALADSPPDLLAEVFSGNLVPKGAAPLAQAYAGHQFGGLAPQLGDGRAVLLGEVIDRAGQRRDIQLKGSGRTAFSRGGDGRAALGPVLREYLVAEAMHALGVPTTRALAATLTGEPVLRETRLPGAVLTRVASSHIRVGTFEYFALRRDSATAQALLAHALARHDPDRTKDDDPALALLEGVARRQARLVASWMGLGFIHGVMNTDNFAISGETIDYGPCAFIDTYHPTAVFSSIDHAGRYAFANQPRIAAWNLARLGEALLSLMPGPEEAAIARANQALETFRDAFEREWTEVLRAKLGLPGAQDGDKALGEGLLELMAAGEADFTNTFRALTLLARTGDDAALRAEFTDPAALAPWLAAWHARREGRATPETTAAMARANPQIIPRNHLVEEALAAATERGELAPFLALHEALATPFDPPADPRYQRPPVASQRVFQTFCGT